MKTFFWISWVSDIIIIICFSFTLLSNYINGSIDRGNTANFINYILMFLGASALVITSIILYNNQWQKTAALIASVPFLSLIFIVLIPIIASISGGKMN